MEEREATHEQCACPSDSVGIYSISASACYSVCVPSSRQQTQNRKALSDRAHSRSSEYGYDHGIPSWTTNAEFRGQHGQEAGWLFWGGGCQAALAGEWERTSERRGVP